MVGRLHIVSIKYDRQCTLINRMSGQNFRSMREPGTSGMTSSILQNVRVIDSHTGGEPTRLVVSGGPELGSGPLAERLECFRRQHDCFRSAVVNEPRGSDVMVGAL